MLGMVPFASFRVTESALLTERLPQILDDVLAVLQSAAQPEEAIRDAGRGPRLGGEVAVRREPRLGDQALHPREAGRVRDQLQALEHPLRGAGAALELEPHHAAESRERATGIG